MSEKQKDILIENLISQWRELSETWDGKDLEHERKMQDVAGELEDYGINVEDLED